MKKRMKYILIAVVIIIIAALFGAICGRLILDNII